MERAEVIVQEPASADGKHRVGAVLSRQGMIYRVRWEDDDEEENVHYGGRYRLAVRGTLQYQALIDPTLIAEMFEADRLAVTLRILREAGSPMTAVQIKAKLVSFGIDSTAVDRGWPAIQERLKKSPTVKLVSNSKAVPKLPGVKSASKSKTMLQYEWAAPAVEPGRDDVSASSEEQAPAAEPVKGTSQESTDNASVEDSTESVPADAAQTVEQGDAVEETARQPLESKGPAPLPSPQTSLTNVFAIAVSDKTPRPLAEYAAIPLRTGAGLGLVDDAVIGELLETLPDQDRMLAVALLAAVPKPVSVLDETEWSTLPEAAIEAVLTAAVAEIQAQPEVRREIRLAAAWLARRAGARQSLRPSAVAPLVALTAHVAASQDEIAGEAIEIVVRLLAGRLSQLPPATQQNLDVASLAAAAACLPLVPGGARAALMAVVGRIRPAALLADVWWSDVALDDLAEVARGVLGGVTSTPSVVERIITPRMVREFSAATTRTRLSYLLGLPREFVAAVPGDAVAAAFRRIAVEDPVVAAWADALTGSDQIESLKRELEVTRGDLDAAARRADAIARREEELADRCERLEELLRREHTESVALRASQERQLQIDVIRALADLAAEVEELAITHAEPDVLVDRVRALVAGQALEPVGTAGGETPYDPALHNPVVGEPEVGSAVTVIRPGYRWYASGEEILIHKALVSGT